MARNAAIHPISEAHASSIQKYVADERIASMCSLPFPYPENGAIEWIRKVREEERTGSRRVFAVLYCGEAIGTMDLKEINRNENRAEFGYWIAVPFWNRGIATQTAQETITFGFKKLELCLLTAHCLAHNAASIRVLAKCGFEQFDESPELLSRKVANPNEWKAYRLTREMFKSQKR